MTFLAICTRLSDAVDYLFSRQQALYPNDLPLIDYLDALKRVAVAFDAKAITFAEADKLMADSMAAIMGNEGFTRNYNEVLQSMHESGRVAHFKPPNPAETAAILALGASLLAGGKPPVYVPHPQQQIYSASPRPSPSFASSAPGQAAIAQPAPIAPRIPVPPPATLTNCFVDSGGFFSCTTTR